MMKATLIKANISLGLAYSFRGSVHCYHGRKHGSVPEKDLRGPHFDQQQQKKKCLPQASRKELSSTLGRA